MVRIGVSLVRGSRVDKLIPIIERLTTPQGKIFKWQSSVIEGQMLLDIFFSARVKVALQL